MQIGAKMAKRTKKLIDNQQIENEIRVNKYLSDAGICSRREADKHIAAGEVTVDGVIAEMGTKVEPGQVVLLKGKPVSLDEHLVLIALNKPRGIVCTTDRREKDNIIDFLNYGKRIYPIGRLDKESEGLILLTNDGNIVNKILRAGNYHEKEYIVTVNKPITAQFLKGMAEGVPILDTVTLPCKIKALSKDTFQIILTQGLNRQIRRMCEYFDYKVLSLKRIRIMNINLGYLQLGGYRNITEKEIAGLNELMAESINHPEPLWNSMDESDDEKGDSRKVSNQPNLKQSKTSSNQRKYTEKSSKKPYTRQGEKSFKGKSNFSSKSDKSNYTSKGDQSSYNTKKDYDGKGDKSRLRNATSTDKVGTRKFDSPRNAKNNKYDSSRNAESNKFDSPRKLDAKKFGSPRKSETNKFDKTTKTDTKFDSRKGDTKKFDSRKSDTKKFDSRKSDTKKFDSKKTEFNKFDKATKADTNFESRKVDSRKFDSRKTESKKFDSSKNTSGGKSTGSNKVSTNKYEKSYIPNKSKHPINAKQAGTNYGRKNK
jgi:23S rRNA pseudouridine2604 synthase